MTICSNCGNLATHKCKCCEGWFCSNCFDLDNDYCNNCAPDKPNKQVIALRDLPPGSNFLAYDEKWKKTDEVNYEGCRIVVNCSSGELSFFSPKTDVSLV